MSFLKKHLWAVAFSILLTAFTLYVLMDTFLITRVYVVVEDDPSFQFEFASSSPASLPEASLTESSLPESSLPESSLPESSGTAGTSGASGGSEEPSAAPSSSAPASSAPAPSAPESRPQEEPPKKPETQDSYSYAGDGVQIEITKCRAYDTTIYVADIVVSSPEHLRTAFAKNAFGRHIAAKTSETAANVNAVLAINGDYYGAQASGYVLRNGTLYRDTGTEGQEDLVVWADGSFEIIREDQVSAAELVERGAWQVLCFGPRLVNNGVVSVGESRLNPRNPRTALGIVDNCHYIFLVADGRCTESRGMTTTQLAEFMAAQGTKVAYNLDGGGSSAMVFQGQLLNNPTSDGVKFGERSVSDIVYIR